MDRKKTKRTAPSSRREKSQENNPTLEEFVRKQPDGDAARKRFPEFDKNGDVLLTRDGFAR